jgi:hypothetical protein
MNVVVRTFIFVLLFSSYSLAQEPVPILNTRWHRTVQPATKTVVTPTSPAQSVIPENKYFQRKAREQRTDNPMDPNEATIEGRSAAMDRAVQQSRTPQPDDTVGFTYTAEMRNDTGKTIAIIFWEYQFTEIAKPTNVIRRQFLCGLKLKDGQRKEFFAFSLLGPSDSIDVESLSKPDQKLFTEKARVNRIEFSDGAILQRDNWKFDDVKEAVARATATPWGIEPCRAL